MGQGVCWGEEKEEAAREDSLRVEEVEEEEEEEEEGVIFSKEVDFVIWDLRRGKEEIKEEEGESLVFFTTHFVSEVEEERDPKRGEV